MFTTWVLGSGFSKSLGGPLLAELFTEAAELQRTSFFPEAEFPRLHDKPAVIAMKLYRLGLKDNHWSNPEDFLDRLDAAVQLGPDSKRWAFFEKFFDYDAIGAPFKSVNASARRVMAAECTAFLVENFPERNVKPPERWQPYIAWSQQLTARDTILSFNYDRVLEHLVATGVPLDIRRLARDALSQQFQEQMRESEGRASVLKLHGSVDWKGDVADGGQKFSVSEDSFFALNAEDEELVIGTPYSGPHCQDQ